MSIKCYEKDRRWAVLCDSTLHIQTDGVEICHGPAQPLPGFRPRPHLHSTHLLGIFKLKQKKRHLLMKWRGSHRFCLYTTLISVHYVGVFSPSSSDSQSEILKVCHKKVTEGDIHLMERDYEYSIEDFLSICPQPISLWWMLPGRVENKIRLVRAGLLSAGDILGGTLSGGQ